MFRWQLILVATLILLPLTLFAGVGGWVLWTSGYWFWLSWSIPVCWTFAWFLIRFGKRIEVPLPEIGSKIHWTPRDHAASKIIEAEQQRVSEFTGEQFTDPQFYTARTIDLATEFARHYHPKASDPLGEVSVIEILTAVQLVAEDLEAMLQDHVPGSHLVSVSQWKLLAKAPALWRTASNFGWIVSTVMNPASLARYAVSKAFVDPVAKRLQSDMLGTFYVLFIRQLGFYLIELNSGRLRGGSARYRATMQRLKGKPAAVDANSASALRPASDPPNRNPPSDGDQPTDPVTVTIAVIGQVKAGKSSLVNCLLGEQRAAVDVLPLTRNVQRYDLCLNETSDHLVLLDTPGYSDAGATREQLSETREAVRNADLVLLVLDARSPAKQADVATLDELAAFFLEQHRLKPPVIVGVVSKIDGLSPLMEWSPPYNWDSPQRPKEKNIHDALKFAQQTFGDRLASIVPICADREHDHVFGIEEYLLPTVSLLLDEARACSLVRSLHRDYDRQRAWQVVSQMMSVGSQIKQVVTSMNTSHLEQLAKTIFAGANRKP